MGRGRLSIDFGQQVVSISAGDRLVVSGAQLLLSEEFRSQIQEE
jgi:hypothetical protein